MKLKSRLRDLLDVEFAGEREVAGLAATDGAPKEGAWRAATHIGHFHHWRRAFGRHLAAVLTGLPAVAPPEDVDAENERQLALDREASPESLVRAWKASWAEMLGLLRNCSEPDLLRGPGWYGSQSVGIAMLRNSYTHPRAHLIDFHFERGRHERAAQLADEIADVAHEFQLSILASRPGCSSSAARPWRCAGVPSRPSRLFGRRWRCARCWARCCATKAPWPACANGLTSKN